MSTNFICKFAPGGGPSPLREIERILDQADSSPGREAWFGTHIPGREWRNPGICIALAAPTLHGIIAEVVGRSDTIPHDRATTELYQDRKGYEEFVAWWRIRNPIRVQFDSLDQIPGRACASGRGAKYTFSRSQVAFAYWDFLGASFDALAESCSTASQASPFRARSLPSAATNVVLQPERLSGEMWPRPKVPLHGADFSGGEEDLHYGNAKIWVASWTPGSDVVLRCGRSTNSADKICRTDLPILIRREPGWWSLDFPFSVAKETGCALSANSWREWLEWCVGAGGATELRNKAKEATKQASVAWSLRRRVDENHGTTWFPL